MASVDAGPARPLSAPSPLAAAVAEIPTPADIAAAIAPPQSAPTPSRQEESSLPDPAAALPPGLSAFVPPASTPTPVGHAVPVAASPQAAPPDLARQLTPAIVQLSHGASGNAVTLQLDPLGLGHVQVRIDRDANGAASVQVTAEHPETLRMLVADQPHLHRALDDAGLSNDGRSLTFALSTQDGGAFGGTENGGTNGRQGGGRNTRPSAWSAGPDDEAGFINPPAWFRAGVDITA